MQVVEVSSVIECTRGCPNAAGMPNKGRGGGRGASPIGHPIHLASSGHQLMVNLYGGFGTGA